MMQKQAKQIVFLDRDGVLNVDRYLTYRLDQLEVVDGVVEGLTILQKLGFEFIIISNQSAIGRGLFTEADLHVFNDALLTQLKQAGITILDLFFCPHDATEGQGDYKKNCACHKPKPGMFFQAQEKYQLNLAECYYIGDKKSDIIAAFNAGCKAILVETGILDDEHKSPGDYPHVRVKDLRRAAHIIAAEVALEYLCTTEDSISFLNSEMCQVLLSQKRYSLFSI